MMKREGKDLDGDQPPKKMQKIENSGPTVRFLIPARAAGLIIGRGGENIKRIRNQVVTHFCYLFHNIISLTYVSLV